METWYAAVWGLLTLSHLPHLSQGKVFTNQWALRLARPDQANRIAEKHGLTSMGQIGHLENYYSFRHNGTARRSAVAAHALTGRLAAEEEVRWLRQQVVLHRVQRNPRASHIYSIDVKSRHAPGGGPLGPHPPALHFNDPQWSKLWYLHRGGAGDPGSCPCDMHIQEAWSRGYSGRGVVVSVLDTGLEREHPDLQANYDPLASADVTEESRDASQQRAPSADHHGTRCAGIVAAAANNSLCTVGVSFHASIGGVRLLDGEVTDVAEARALGVRPQHVDIYLAPWGPPDDGATLEGPGPLASLALERGALTGRGGRGSIFVWASGNGGLRGDHCSCDGYTNSIYTVSISGTTQGGGRPAYLEDCSSTLASAYGGGDGPGGMITLDGGHACVEDHSGTSASSSMAAGVIALMLEANPLLGWRDVQHLLVRTSRSEGLQATDWQENGAGLRVSHLFGFGLLDADLLVREALIWTPVAPHHMCEEPGPVPPHRLIGPGSVLRSVLQTSGCPRSPLSHVVYVEHVVVRLTVTHRSRGDLSISLLSPSGTVSRLLSPRPLDVSTEGLVDWEFMSTQCWGERSAGSWVLEIRDLREDSGEPGALGAWSLVLFGSSEVPYGDSVRRARAHPAEASGDSTVVGGNLADQYSGPCDPLCGGGGCGGAGPQHCVTCLHLLLDNHTRECVAECPEGFWAERGRCRRCSPSCRSCTGSRADQCLECPPGQRLAQGTSGSCTAGCEDGSYLDHDANACRKCGEYCLKCNSSGTCAECQAGTRPQGHQCKTSCGLGFYRDHRDPQDPEDPPEHACRPCHPACATCTGPGAEGCDRCGRGFLMEEWRCVSSCSPGFYQEARAQEQGTCRRCPAGCAACEGTALCTSCSPGLALQGPACADGSPCGEGRYRPAGGACRRCDPSCLSCSGPGRQHCLRCDPPHFLDQGGHCGELCPPGTYGAGGRCHLCDHTCSTCLEEGPDHCSSCDLDKFGTQRYLLGGRCVLACPEAFYPAGGRVCAPCPAHCRTCSAQGGVCLACSAPYVLREGACAGPPQCGEGEVEDPDVGDCMVCEEGCKKCVLYNPRHCLSCIEGFYRFQDGCVRFCPAQTFVLEQSLSCVPCDPGCVRCDAQRCSWCETDLFLSDGVCVAACADGLYAGEDTHACERCHPSCRLCGGPGPEACLTCRDTGVRGPLGGRCEAGPVACPAGTFRSDGAVCEACHPLCDSCSGEEENQCETCVKGLVLTPQHTCAPRCPTAHTPQGGACRRCPPACYRCASPSHCSECEEFHFLFEGSCVPGCPQRFYDDADQKACVGCHSSCLSCDGPGATDCDSCPDPEAPPHSGACLPGCPAHFYRDTATGECRECDASCWACRGPHATSCVSCKPPQTPDQQGRCGAPRCPAHRYTHQDGGCLHCHPYCHQCSGPGTHHCSSCHQNHMLLNGSCVDSCPAGYYLDPRGRQCLACPPTCESCMGEHQCVRCKDHLFRHGPDCLEVCPHSHYGDAASRACARCSPACGGACLGPGSEDCLSCPPGRLYLHSGRRCVNTCPPDHHPTGSTCEPCHARCKTCTGEGAHRCGSCHHGDVLSDGLCVAVCMYGQYLVALVTVASPQDPAGPQDPSCEDCAPSCLECMGPGPTNCTRCPALALLSAGGRCLPCCPPQDPREEGEDSPGGPSPQQQDCCNCSETQGECILGTNFAFRNNEEGEEEEEEDSSGNLAVFITSGVLLVAGVAGVVLFVRRSRSQSAPQPDLVIPRGYEKLGSAGGYANSSTSGRFLDSQRVERGPGDEDEEEDDDDDEEEDEDIVYMGQDGTVYRKFRYGRAGDDAEDGLEYDDESYAFR